MIHIFYFFGLIALLYEILVIFNTAKILDYSETVIKDKSKNMTGTQAFFILCLFLYIIWAFVGLLSFNWILFLALILLSVIGTIITKITKNRIVKIIYRKFDGILSACILLFIILNKYHLHINLYELIKNYLIK